MLILADENMPFAREAFSQLGEVRLAPGRRITRESLGESEVLAVRSVTRVDENLLSGSRVRFVGTATIGTDHVDTAYLERAGLGFAAAPGCNAVSVAEYVVAALFELARRGGFRLQGKSLGVIGAGNVGRRVAARAAALGLEVRLNDPPLFDRTGDPQYRPLKEVIGSDILTLHVPLEKGGPYPTYHMVDAGFIGRMKEGARLFNSSRGAVAETGALEAGLACGKLSAAVLDVWEGEPEISLSLLCRVSIATPHIAGYSFDGKVRGMRMIYEAAARYFGHTPEWDPESLLPPPENARLSLEGEISRAQEILSEAVAAGYDIMADDRRLRETLTLPQPERGAWFDCLRREYPVRREWASRTVSLGKGLAILRPALEGLGFKVEGRGK